ncbi:MAG: Fic family protein [Thermoplasmata archaeon]
MVRKRKVDSNNYYYLEHSVRFGNKVEKRERYLGKTVPDNIDEIEFQFMTGIFAERWFRDLNQIKAGYEARMKESPPSVHRKDMELFSVRFTYNTNRIEGSRLTLRDTSLLLEKGITPKSRPSSDVKEAEAHRDAFFEMLGYRNSLSIETILHFHRKLFESTDQDVAGALRRVQVGISGSRFTPPLAIEVQSMLSEFIRWYRKNKDVIHPVQLAALVHLKLVTIHPFADGNGRISRLMMNLVLHQKGFPMLDIPYENRSSYYNALERSQVKSDDYIFLQWFFRRYVMENGKYLK